METKKILVFARKPTKGGNPAKESKTKENKKAIILLDLNKDENSDNSLLALFINLCFNLNKIKTDQIKTPDNK